MLRKYDELTLDFASLTIMLLDIAVDSAEFTLLFCAYF